MSKLVTFDLDGTLIDSMGDIVNAVNLMRESFGLERLPEKEAAAMTGNGVVALCTRAIAGTGLPVDEAVKRQRQFYSDNLVVTTALYPGVEEGLETMKAKGFHLAVVTNKPTPHARGILERLKVHHFFDEIWGGDSGFPLKPDPAALLAFQKQWGTPAENCWMLGDHYTDLGAGRGAGFVRAMARWGYGEERDEKFDHEFFSFADFTAAVIQ